MQHLTQALDEIDPEARVLPTVESIRRVTKTLDGQEITATSLLERFGFTGDKLTARIGDLSGGERRRVPGLRRRPQDPAQVVGREHVLHRDRVRRGQRRDLLAGQRQPSGRYRVPLRP